MPSCCRAVPAFTNTGRRPRVRRSRPPSSERFSGSCFLQLSRQDFSDCGPARSNLYSPLLNKLRVARQACRHLACGSPLKCESIAASPSWRCVSLPRVAVIIHRPPRPRQLRRRSLSTARGPALSPAMFQVYRLVRRPSRSRTLVRRCLVRGLRSTLIRRSIRLGLLVERRAECRLKERSHRPSLPSADTPSTRR